MGAPSIKVLKREVIGSTTFVQAIFDDAGTNEPFANDVFPGPCRLFRIDLTWFSGPEVERQGFLKIYDDKEPRLGLSVPDFILPFVAAREEDDTVPILIPGVPLEGMDFSVGCSFTVTSEGGTGGIQGPTNEDVQLTLILTELGE